MENGTVSGFLTNWTSQLLVLRQQLSTADAASLESLGNQRQSLSDDLTAWSSRLPAYDLRRSEAELRIISQDIASASLRLKPKARFSFKKSSTGGGDDPVPVPIGITESAPPLSLSSSSMPVSARVLQASAPPPVPINALNLSSKGSRYLTSRDLPTSNDPAASSSSGSANGRGGGQALVVAGLRECFVDLLRDEGEMEVGDEEVEKLSALYLYDLKDSVVLVSPIEGSIMVHGCTNCIFVLGSHQFRMHKSSNCGILLQITSTPIIESCKSLAFSPYPSFLSRRRLPPSSFSQVSDFDFPFASDANPSPNWRVESQELSESRWKSSSGRSRDWKQLIPPSL